jgi:hypothetical protein
LDEHHPFTMQKLGLKQSVQRKVAYYESRLRTILSASGCVWWPDDRRIQTYKDVHKGQRAFILGNGPSLTIADLDCLKSEITFASNKIFLSFPDTTWRPTYYVLSDLLVAAQNGETISKLPLTKFLTNYSRAFVNGDKKTIWFNEIAGNYHLNFLEDYDAVDPDTVRFSTDATLGLEGGGTVIFNQLQLAYFMGISEIVLLGLDFSFNTKGNARTATFFDQALVSTGEKNHFHPDYRKAGEVWAVPNMGFQRLSFRRAKEQYAVDGRSIVNGSRATALDVFPRINLDSLLKSRPRVED